jgi:pimeloyl-ACP methyl ester carboxylesterase
LNESIPYDEFGGSGPILHFAHSNGYTPGCFRQMLQPLTADYYVTGIRLRPLWPGSDPNELDSWDVIASDLRDFFVQQGYRQVIGIGQSLGAVATMMAAGQNPDLFQALVLIEPVFLPPDILNMIAAQPELAEKMPLLPLTRRRRTHWPDRQAAFAHFRQKTVFKRWSDETIWDYVNYGLHETDQGEVTLTYSREWEARFYEHPPLKVWQDIPKVTQPTLAIRGTDSDTLIPQSWQLWQELQPEATFVEISNAGHMVTMERPRVLATAIYNYLKLRD